MSACFTFSLSRYFVAVLIMVTASSAGGKNVAPGSGDRLLLVSPETQVVIQVVSRSDGELTNRKWNQAIDRLFNFFDRDGDERLSAEEAVNLPTAFTLRQVVGANFRLMASHRIPWQQLDRDSSRFVSPDELREYYRASGLTGCLIAFGKPPHTAELEEAIWRWLDRDDDGLLSKVETVKLLQTWNTKDANSDQLISPGELVERLTYPGARGSIYVPPWSSSRSVSRSTPIAANQVDEAYEAVIRIANEDQDATWAEHFLKHRDEDADGQLVLSESKFFADRFAELDSDNNQRLSVEELRAWLELPADLNLELEDDVGQPLRCRVSVTHAHFHCEQQEIARVTGDNGIAIDVWALSSIEDPTWLTWATRLQQLFDEADTNGDAQISGEEINESQPEVLMRLIQRIDTNGDQGLAETELEEWLSIVAELRNSHEVVTILDYGRGLFESIDRRRDGAISATELEDFIAGIRDLQLEANQEIGFDMLKDGMTRQRWEVIVSRNQPVDVMGRPIASAPIWFTGMDRNGDGVVSAAEFVGSAEQFGQLDTNGDGRVTIEEARLINE